jgi:hypothetical protein
MQEMHDGTPAPAGEPSRRRPLRRRMTTVPVSERAIPIPEPPPEPDRTAALVTHTEERYQALQLRLDRIESAFRRLVQANRDAVRSTDRTAKALLTRIDALVTSVEAVAARQEQALRAADARHRAELTEFARRAGRAVAAVGANLRKEFATSAEGIREGLEQLHLDLSTTAERIAGHEHPPAAATMTPELEIALRESAQRQEALLYGHLAAVRDALEQARPGEASAPPPATRGVASGDASAFPTPDGFGQIEDGLASVAGELSDLR